jgi:hypothetical protein
MPNHPMHPNRFRSHDAVIRVYDAAGNLRPRNRRCDVARNGFDRVGISLKTVMLEPQK